jgi:ribosomal protein RSM22 (predicted rRNA methylase)
MDEPSLLGAYLLFFWPVSYAQARQVLGELPRFSGAALDLASGPGPLAFAALDAGAREVTIVDRSAAALAAASGLAADAGEALSVRRGDVATARPAQIDVRGPFDLISIGHGLNEMYEGQLDASERRAEMLDSWMGLLKDGGSLLIIEPALRETSRNLLRVRDLLVQRGRVVRAPCLYRGNCPALVKESDWCHAERNWRRPPLVEAIAAAAGLRKESLKMSYLLMASPQAGWNEPPPGRAFRIVSEPLRGKGRLRYMGCGPEGRIGLALQEKHRTEENKAFFALQRGDVVVLTHAEPRGDGLALNERSEVRVVAPAGRPVASPSS